MYVCMAWADGLGFSYFENDLRARYRSCELARDSLSVLWRTRCRSCGELGLRALRFALAGRLRRAPLAGGGGDFTLWGRPKGGAKIQEPGTNNDLQQAARTRLQNSTPQYGVPTYVHMMMPHTSSSATRAVPAWERKRSARHRDLPSANMMSRLNNTAACTLLTAYLTPI